MKDTYVDERLTIIPMAKPAKRKKTPEEKAKKLRRKLAKLDNTIKVTASVGPRFMAGDVVRINGGQAVMLSWPTDNKGAYAARSAGEPFAAISGFADPKSAGMDKEFGAPNIVLIRRPKTTPVNPLPDPATLVLALDGP